MEWQPSPADVQLTDSDVHVWQAHLDLPVEQIQAFTQILSPDEQARAQQFRFEKHRQRFIAGRGILRSLLARYLNLEPNQLKFDYGSHGKPFLSDFQHLQFNLAHSQDLALYAMTLDRAVGIDVEYIRAIEDLESLAHRFFAPREHAVICEIPIDQRSNIFFRYWTCKEAYLKATGEGLAKLKGLEISLSLKQAAKLEQIPTIDSLENWSLQELYPMNQFVGAICSKSEEKNLTFQQFCVSESVI